MILTKLKKKYTFFSNIIERFVKNGRTFGFPAFAGNDSNE